MNFLLPAFFAAAAVTAVPIVLHLLRLQPRKIIPFPSLRLLGSQALRDARRQSLRRWLTLLLRCLAILLLIAAFARPFWKLEHSDHDRAVVVLVDNSYSMQARGRKEAVAAWMAPLLKAMRRPDQLGVITLHPAPEWVVPMTRDLEAGRNALKALPDAYEVSNYRAGLELAAAKLATTDARIKQIVLAGDQQRLGWNTVRFERTLPPGVQLHVAPPAAAPDRQAAVTALKLVRLGDGRIGVDATIRSYGTGPEERTVTFLLGETRLGAEKTVLMPGNTNTVHAEFAVPDANAPLGVRAVIDADDLTVDDTAYAALAAANDRRVLLAPNPATGVDFLRLALEAIGAGEPTASLPPGSAIAFAAPKAPAAGAGAPEKTPGSAPLPKFRVEALAEGRAWSPASVVVLRGPAPFRPGAVGALDTFLSSGGSAWLICDGSEEQKAWLAGRGVSVSAAPLPASGHLKLRDLALEHPLFTPFAGHSVAPLLTPKFHRGWALDGPAVEALARWPDRTAAIAEVAVGPGRLLLTGFRENRADSTLPTEAMYVPFVHQAIAWLAEAQVTVPIGGRIGTTFVLPGPGTWRPLLTARPVTLREVDGHVTPNVPGLYAFEQPGAVPRYYAVNLDTTESDLAPWPAGFDPQRLVSREPAAPRPPKAKVAAGTKPVINETLVEEHEAWWWLLAAVILFLMAEVALANRTVP